MGTASYSGCESSSGAMDLETSNSEVGCSWDLVVDDTWSEGRTSGLAESARTVGSEWIPSHECSLQRLGQWASPSSFNG